MRYSNYDVEDFIKEEYFQKWVLNSDSMTDNFWNNWLFDHPEKKEVIEKAKRFLLLLDFDNNELSDIEFASMWRKIVEQRGTDENNSQLLNVSKKPKLQFVVKFAAVFVGLITTGFGIYLSGILDFDRKVPLVNDTQITLELNDGTVKILKETPSKTITNALGEKVVNQQHNTLVYEDNASNSETLAYNQLTVPYGKRFDLVLSDGSHVFLNSGSKLRYPVNFLKNGPRNVYLNGEAYFSVAKDKLRPFTVITDEMNTQVYGTKFNVSSYKNENNTSTVLVEGSVGVYKSNNEEGSKPIIISPGQRAVFEDNTIAVDRVNVNKYIAWKEGKLLFVDDSFKLILKELERHFNVQIDNQYIKLNAKHFTGTFDSESLEQILQICQENTPFDYVVDGNKVKISERK